MTIKRVGRMYERFSLQKVRDFSDTFIRQNF